MKYRFALYFVLIVAALSFGCAHEDAVAPQEPDPVAPAVDYVSQQEILVALPMRVRLPSRYGAERVLVFFRTWGSRGWSSMELSRAGQSWSGEISCREVSTVTGDTRYFFLALNDDGDAVVGSGSPEWPHVATVVRSLPEGPSALDGENAPVRCHDPADCPPDFPGCPSYTVLRPACRIDNDCHGGICAWDGYCETRATESTDDASDEDDDVQLAKAINAAKRKYKAIAASRRSSRPHGAKEISSH